MVPKGLELKNEMAYLLIHACTEHVELLNRQTSVVSHHSLALLDQVDRKESIADDFLFLGSGEAAAEASSSSSLSWDGNERPSLFP